MEPSYNFELFVKNLPRNWYESELLAYFSSAGFVYQIRLLMEYSGRNRGIAFVRYTSQEDFNQSLKMWVFFLIFWEFYLIIIHYLRYNRAIIDENHVLCAMKSENWRTLIVINIDERIDNEYLRNFFYEHTLGGRMLYTNQLQHSGNRYALIQFRCHYQAALGRRNLLSELRNIGQDAFVRWFHRSNKWEKNIFYHKNSWNKLNLS